MKDTLLLTLRVGTLIMVIGFVVCELFPGCCERIYVRSGPQIMAVKGIRLAFIMLPVVGFQIIISNFFQSISKAPKAIFMSLSRQVIFLIPSLYLFSKWFGLTGVWLSIPFSDLLAALVALILILREKRFFYPSQQQRA